MQEKGRLGSKKNKKKEKREEQKKNQGRAHKKLGAPLFSGSSQIGKKQREGKGQPKRVSYVPFLLLLSTHSCAAAVK